MFLLIWEPSTDVTLVSRRIAPNEVLDCRAYALAYAASVEQEIDESGGYVPSFAGDIRVEIRTRKADGVCVWTSANFYFLREGY